jgi:hypothetical protein
MTSENIPGGNTTIAFADYFCFRDLAIENALQKITMTILNAKTPGNCQAFF